MFDDRSAYPHPDEFKVMRPEYIDLAPDAEEGEEDAWHAAIVIAPFRVTGQSITKPGARRAALYEAAKEYRNYHPSYRIKSPFPDEFEDQEGRTWKRVKPSLRQQNGDYEFTDEYGEDYADIEQMLQWDVRPATDEEAEDDE